MSYIEEKITVFAPVDSIWKAWADNYLQTNFEVGTKGHVVNEKKGVKFKIQYLKKNESLTIIWYSFLVKFIFHHQVEAKDIGSLVTCKVTIKGFFSFLIKPLIAGKIRKNLQMSLKQFAKDLKDV